MYGRSEVRTLSLSNRTQCRRRLATAVIFLWTAKLCKCLALSRGLAEMGSDTRCTLRRNIASEMKILFEMNELVSPGAAKLCILNKAPSKSLIIRFIGFAATDSAQLPDIK